MFHLHKVKVSNLLIIKSPITITTINNHNNTKDTHNNIPLTLNIDNKPLKTMHKSKAIVQTKKSKTIHKVSNTRLINEKTQQEKIIISQNKDHHITTAIILKEIESNFRKRHENNKDKKENLGILVRIIIGKMNNVLKMNSSIINLLN